MSLSYAGCTLGLLTTDYRAFLEQWHSLVDFKESDLWGYASKGIDHLPLPSVPLPELPLIGKLVWPTSFSRCGYAHYLVDSTNLAAIRTALGSGNGPANLVISDGTNTKTVSMSFLCARPLSQITGEPQAYLLTLVDKRWKSRTLTGTLSTPVSWSALFTSLASALGITLTVDTISANYGAPTSRWAVYEKPLGVILDAACNAIGHKLVANVDGTFKTQTYTTAVAAAHAQTNELTKTAGGLFVAGDLVRSVPATVKTVFPDTTSVTPHYVSKTLVGLALSGYGSATGVSGQVASVNGELRYDGTNATACSNYATQAATDFYNWQLIDLDLTYPGTTEWTPTGAEDRIEWIYEIGRILTRVVRGPFQTLTFGSYEATTSTAATPSTGTANTIPYYQTPTSISESPMYVVPATNSVTAYTVSNVAAASTTTPISQLTVDNSGTPTITQSVLTNGTSGGNGIIQTLTPTQYVVNNTLNSTTSYEGVIASGGVLQNVIGNATLTQGQLQYPTISSGNVTQFTVDNKLWNGSSILTGTIVASTSGSGVVWTGTNITLAGSLAGSTAPTVAGLTSDFTLSSTSFTNVTGLSFSVAASEVWDFDITLYVETPTSSQGVYLQITGPSSPTGFSFGVQGNSGSDSTTASEYVSALSTTTFIKYAAFTGSIGYSGAFINIKGRLRNGSNAGTIQLQAKLAGLVTPPNQKIFKESVLRAYKN